MTYSNIFNWWTIILGNSHWICKQFDFNDDPENVEIHVNDASLFDYSTKIKKNKNVKLKHSNVGGDNKTILWFWLDAAQEVYDNEELFHYFWTK